MGVLSNNCFQSFIGGWFGIKKEKKAGKTQKEKLNYLDKLFLVFWGGLFFYFCFVAYWFNVAIRGLYPYHLAFLLGAYLLFRLAFEVLGGLKNIKSS